MITVVSALVRIFKRNLAPIYGYKKSRDLFLLFLATAIVISSVIGLSRSQPVFAQPSLQSESAHAGAIPMTASQIVNHISHDNKHAFWLGPKEGYLYTPNCEANGQVIITYLQPHAKLSNQSQRRLVLDTYSDAKSYSSEPIHSLASSVDSVNYVTPKGNLASYSKDSMNVETVRLRNAPQVVIIHYITNQTASMMIQNADALIRTN